MAAVTCPIPGVVSSLACHRCLFNIVMLPSCGALLWCALQPFKVSSLASLLSCCLPFSAVASLFQLFPPFPAVIDVTAVNYRPHTVQRRFTLNLNQLQMLRGVRLGKAKLQMLQVVRLGKANGSM